MESGGQVNLWFSFAEWALFHSFYFSANELEPKECWIEEQNLDQAEAAASLTGMFGPAGLAGQSGDALAETKTHDLLHFI